MLDDKQDLQAEIRNIVRAPVKQEPWDVGTRFHRHLKEVALETVQDCRPYIDYAKALRDCSKEREKRSAIRMAHTVPMVVYKQCLTELGIPHGRMYKLTPDERARLGVLLRSPDYKLLRTTEGKL